MIILSLIIQIRAYIFKQGDSSNRPKMRGFFQQCFFQQILRQNVSWFLSWHRKTFICRDFVSKFLEITLSKYFKALTTTIIASKM